MARLSWAAVAFALSLFLLFQAAASTIQLSTDNGVTWHAPAATSGISTTKLPAPLPGGTLSARAPSALASAPVAAATGPNGCAAATLVRWSSAAGAPPFALGWARSPAVARRVCAAGVPVEVRVADVVVPSLKPRWAGHLRRFTAEDKIALEEAAAAGGGLAVGENASWWARHNKWLLPVALLAIVALGHGIYLGITAMEEDEAAELRLREERLLRRINGKQGTSAKVAASAPRPSRKKRQVKQ